MNITLAAPYADPERGAAVVRLNSMKRHFELGGHFVRIIAKHRESVPAALGVERYKSGFLLFTKILLSNSDGVIGTSPPITENFFALAACKIKRIPFILDAKDPFTKTIAAMYPEKAKSIKFGLLKLIEKIVYSFSDSIIFLNEGLMKETIAEFKIPEKKCFLAPNGVDANLIRPDPIARKAAREKYSIPKESPVIVYSGGIGDKDLKGFFENSAQPLVKKGFHIFFLVCLDNFEKNQSLFREVEGIISSKGISKNVHIEKNLAFEDLNSYYAASDFGLVPYPDFVEHCVGAKVFDYIASGLFIAAKSSPLNAELKSFLEGSKAGFYSTSWNEFNSKFSKLEIDDAKRRRGEIRNFAMTCLRGGSNDKILSRIKELRGD